MTLLFTVFLTGCDNGSDFGGETDTTLPGTQSEEAHNENALKMNAAQRKEAGIETALVTLRGMSKTVEAPGEVHVNAYRSSQITSRISAQIVARHARLGEIVKEGRPMVTLSSVEVAQAQGELFETDREWRRVAALGRKVVSEKRFIKSQVARQRAYAAVRAYGMTEKQIKRLLSGGDASRATGNFDLLSPQDGVVISDDFQMGEVVESGRTLFEVSDESRLWVEARLRPEDAKGITVDLLVEVSSDGQNWLPGKVVQQYHRLNITTRTLSVRIEVENHAKTLHPGEYVQVRLQTSVTKPVLAVPNEALILMQGSPTVIKLTTDNLHPEPVVTGITLSGWTEIKAGLSAGDEIAVKGTFVIKSLILKSQIGDAH
ncbi:hypothetical protein MNBD_GAMMA21-1799 [hydrothermal vent metagenome]|uniref:Uncharacterized protein n=1 Tax=hydrothermal vent metagenome TaxID=652676 RepID=A0A3B0ZXR6_9ZZZZ